MLQPTPVIFISPTLRMTLRRGRLAGTMWEDQCPGRSLQPRTESRRGPVSPINHISFFSLLCPLASSLWEEEQDPAWPDPCIPRHDSPACETVCLQPTAPFWHVTALDEG